MYSNNENLKKNSLKLQIEPYRQTTNYTCVAASYLVCLNHLFPSIFSRDRETELNIHNKIKFWEGGEGEYGSYPKLARHALNLGLNVHMVLQGPTKPEFIPLETWERYMENFLPIIDDLKKINNFKFEKKDFNTLDLLNEIEKGYIPIVEINYPSPECTHHIVIRGFEGKRIKVLDPIKGYSGYNLESFEKIIDLGYMKNFISLQKPNSLELSLVASGLAASKGEVRGEAQIIKEYEPDFQAGNILVAPRTDPDMVPNMILSSGIITDIGGILCHAAIVAREIGVPAVVGTRNSTTQIKNKDQLYLDGNLGKVYRISKNESSL